jgi:hypothetical protein
VIPHGCVTFQTMNIFYMLRVGLYENIVYTKKILTSDTMCVRENRLSCRDDPAGRSSSTWNVMLTVGFFKALEFLQISYC